MDLPLTLVVVTHDSAGWLPALAASWGEAQRVAGVSDVPVVVADAGSTDDTRRVAAELFPRARVLELKNGGYGASANAAMGAVRTPWALLSNADITVGADFLARCSSAMRGAVEATGGIAPKLVNADGSVQPSIGRFPTMGTLLRDQFRPRPWRKYMRPQPEARGAIDWASGACLLLRCAAVAAVGGFDEKYFLYVEEVDLQRRLQDAGWKMQFEPAMRVTHHAPNAARAPRPAVRRYAARGMLRYFAKFGGLTGYRALGLLSLRLSVGEAVASRQEILAKATGP